MARPRKPTSVLKIQGTYRKDRRKNNEPMPETGKKITMPSFLKGEAAKEWKRLAPSMIEAGTLTDIDRALFAAYCYEWGLYVELSKQTNIDKLEVQKSDPIGRTRNAALTNAKALAAQFGLTPSSRAQLDIDPPKAKNPFETMLVANGLKK